MATLAVFVCLFKFALLFVQRISVSCMHVGPKGPAQGVQAEIEIPSLPITAVADADGAF